MSDLPERLAGVSNVDCTGLQALVTGSTSGIGRATALALGRLGADVIVHGRDARAGAEVVAELSESGVDATFLEADFATIGAVRDFATAVRNETDGLDLLVNNAGGLFRNGTTTDAGVEYTFHVNHLSPYLLTTELLEHLREDARIVTTASAAHRGASLNLDRVRGGDRYTGFEAYSHSKLANVLFAAELARRLEAVPGVTSVADGAAELLFVAVSPRTATVSGRYFTDQRPRTPSESARDGEAARRLWSESAELLGIDEPLAERHGPSVTAGGRTDPGDPRRHRHESG